MQDNNLFEMYFKFVDETEAPMQFHRWSLIASIGALLERQFWLPFGSNRIFPNSYIMLVGNPGTRKSSAIKGVKKVLSAAGYSNFSADKTTKEKFLLDLEGLPENYGDTPYDNRSKSRAPRDTNVSSADVLRNLTFDDDETIVNRVPRSVFVCADEFNEFTGSGNIDFFSLLGALWDWDDEHSTYKYRLKNSKSLSIYQPTISILGGNTHTGIQTGFPSESIGQGFMSRLLFIHGEPSGKKIAFPRRPPEELSQRISSFIGEIKSTVTGEARMVPAAERALDTIYRTWGEIDDYRFKHYSTRRFTHLLKIVLICAAMRKSTVIDMQDVLLANTMLTHAEHQMPKALGEFGKSRNSEATQAIMSRLYDANKALGIPELWTIVSRDLDKKDQLMDILSGLQTSGKIQFVKEANGFLPLRRPINSKALYVDFKLLKENQ